jgi:hypothetical protein
VRHVVARISPIFALNRSANFLVGAPVRGGLRDEQKWL